jgi:hypothetical protein
MGDFQDGLGHRPRATDGALVNARLRKLIGLVGMMVFLGAYIWLMATIGEHMPAHWAAQVVFYAVAGVCWGIPILPLISWMNRGR